MEMVHVSKESSQRATNAYLSHMTMTLDEFRAATKKMGICQDAGAWLLQQNKDDLAASWATTPVRWYGTFFTMLMVKQRSLAGKVVDVGRDAVAAWTTILAEYTAVPHDFGNEGGFDAPAYLVTLLNEINTEPNEVSCARYVSEVISSGPVNLSAYLFVRYGRAVSDEARGKFEDAVRAAVLAHVTADDVKAILVTP